MHVSWFDAIAYCKWAHKRLPTEAEWEWAARGGLQNRTYPWGNEPVDAGKPKTNTWQGHFPYDNTVKDKFYSLAPVASFAPNGYGLYDMAGNVWEWCNDYYNYNYYQTISKTGGVIDPLGLQKATTPKNPMPQNGLFGADHSFVMIAIARVTVLHGE